MAEANSFEDSETKEARKIKFNTRAVVKETIGNNKEKNMHRCHVLIREDNGFHLKIQRLGLRERGVLIRKGDCLIQHSKAGQGKFSFYFPNTRTKIEMDTGANTADLAQLKRILASIFAGEDQRPLQDLTNNNSLSLGVGPGFSLSFVGL